MSKRVINRVLPCSGLEMIFHGIFRRPSALAGAVVDPQPKADAHDAIEGGLVLKRIARCENILPPALKGQRDSIAIRLLVAICDFPAFISGAAHSFDKWRQQAVVLPATL